MQHNALCNFTMRISGMKSKWALNKIKTQQKKKFITGSVHRKHTRGWRGEEQSLASIPPCSESQPLPPVFLPLGIMKKLRLLPAIMFVRRCRARAYGWIQRTHIHTCNCAVIISLRASLLDDPPSPLLVPRRILAVEAHKHCKIPRFYYRQLPALFV